MRCAVGTQQYFRRSGGKRGSERFPDPILEVTQVPNEAFRTSGNLGPSARHVYFKNQFPHTRLDGVGCAERYPTRMPVLRNHNPAVPRLGRSIRLELLEANDL